MNHTGAINGRAPKSNGKRGAPRKYSNLAIKTVLALRPVCGIPLRQAEGFLRSLIQIMTLDLNASEHTTLSR